MHQRLELLLNFRLGAGEFAVAVALAFVCWRREESLVFWLYYGISALAAVFADWH